MTVARYGVLEYLVVVAVDYLLEVKEGDAPYTGLEEGEMLPRGRWI